MSRFAALLFDFDGVLIESEYEGNRHLAEWLSANGHPHTPEEAMAHYMGLAGPDFVSAIEARIGRALPDSFREAREVEKVEKVEAGSGEEQAEQKVSAYHFNVVVFRL